MDRLDRLTEQLLRNLDQQGDEPLQPDCVRSELLARLAAGRLDSQRREQVESHLDGCMICLDRFIAIRDDLLALKAPEPVSPRLAQALDALLGMPTTQQATLGLIGQIRRALEIRIPVWVAAGAVVVSAHGWLAGDRLHRLGAPIPSSTAKVETEQRAQPAHAQLQRTIAGVVSAVRDANSNGVEAHIVDVRDASGATYVLFAWGRPTLRAGDTVEADAIFAVGSVQPASPPVYQGVATALRKVR